MPPPVTLPPGYTISTDQDLLDLDAIHAFLATCYWSPGIARPRLERAIRNSLCFGLYAAPPTDSSSSGGRPVQAGFARVITDSATYAYLCDVFVLEPHRGKGLSKALMAAFVNHPNLTGLRRLCLMTKDAHGLYAQFGFGPTPDSTRYMERVDRESYKHP
ncbi:MAG: GNAT family N-acetyltransferase [Phycisphaerales bacterium]